MSPRRFGKMIRSVHLWISSHRCPFKSLSIHRSLNSITTSAFSKGQYTLSLISLFQFPWFSYICCHIFVGRGSDLSSFGVDVTLAFRFRSIYGSHLFLPRRRSSLSITTTWHPLHERNAPNVAMWVIAENVVPSRNQAKVLSMML